jgi:uncharacterized membrane protein
MIETIRAILAFATDKGAISSADAIRIEAESAALQRAKYMDRSKGGWVVAPSANDHVAGSIATLAERFETITLFDEFTEGIAWFKSRMSWNITTTCSILSISTAGVPYNHATLCYTHFIFGIILTAHTTAQG